MPEFLVRPARTLFTERLIETAYFLLVVAGMCVGFQPGLTASFAGACILAVAVVWKLRRMQAAEALPARRCTRRQEVTVHNWAWRTCALLGPLMIIYGQEIPTRFAGLAVIACGIAVVFTNHWCRFTDQCHLCDLV